MIVDLYRVKSSWGDTELWNTPQFATCVELTKTPEMAPDDTTYFKYVMERVREFDTKEGRERWGCSKFLLWIDNEDKARAATQTFIDIFFDIKANGLKRKINVFLRDNGDASCIDGSHRAAIMFFLGYRYLEAIVGSGGIAPHPYSDPARPRGYSDKIAGLMERVGTEKRLYNPVDHPAFRDWYALRNSDVRFCRIASEVDYDERVLDLGSHNGYFCHRFKRLGFETEGVDNNIEYIEIANDLNELYGMAVKFHHSDALSFVEANPGYDAVLLLSVIHHMERVSGLDYVKKLLNTIDSKKVFIETVWDKEELAKGLEITSETVVDWMAENTKYLNNKLIGYDSIQKRPVHMFYIDEV